MNLTDCCANCKKSVINFPYFFFFFQAEDGIRDIGVTGDQTCALPIYDFGATYRYMLRSEDKPDGLELIVDGKAVLPVDPLFTLPSGRYYLPPENDGAILIQDR